MKNNLKTLSSILLIINFLFSFGNLLSGQEEADTFDINKSIGREKINISAGSGLPEFFNTGVRCQFKQIQIGLSTGVTRYEFYRGIAVSGDFFYHFGGSSELSSLRPWYCRVGFTYWKGAKTEEAKEMGLFNLIIGRDINISNNIGIYIEVGGRNILFEKWRETKPQPMFEFGGDGFASFGIGVFYRIL